MSNTSSGSNNHSNTDITAAEMQQPFDNDYNVEENLAVLVICVFGFILNFFCILIFIKNDLRNKSRYNLFNYYLYVAICSFMVNICNSQSLVMYIYITNIPLKSIEFKIYFFLAGVITLLINLLELTASFIRYITIDERCKFIRDRLIDYRLIILGEFLFSVLVSIYRVFQTNLIDIENFNQLTDLFQIKYNSSNVHLKWIGLLYSVLRDVTSPLLLLVINFLMVVQFRKSMSKKKEVQGGANSTNSVEKSQNDVTRMVFFISSKNILCHLPYFLTYLPVSSGFTKTKMFQIPALILLELSFCFNFFIFLKFNKRFKENFFLFISQCFRKTLK